MKKYIMASVMALAVALPAQGALLSRLEAQWSFEGSDASVRWDDTSGNGIDITARNRINVVDGSFNLFDGFSGQAAGYQHTSNPPNQNAAWLKVESGGNFNRASQLDPIAVEFRFKPVSGNHIGDLLDYGTVVDAAFSFHYSGGRYLTVLWHGDEDGGGDGLVTGQTSTFEVANGEWSRARFVYDGTTVQAWHNEDQIINQAWTHGIRNPTLSPTNALRMFHSSGILGYYNGNLDEVEISSEFEGILGDFDNNNVVDGADFLLWQRDPNIGDLADWEANYGAPGAVSAFAQVPEPAGLLLMLLGMVPVCRLRTRRD